MTRHPSFIDLNRSLVSSSPTYGVGCRYWAAVPHEARYKLYQWYARSLRMRQADDLDRLLCVYMRYGAAP